MATQDTKKHRIHRRIFVVVLVVIVLLGVGGWLAYAPERIQPGMSLAEVETLLGQPDGRMLAIQGTPIDDIVYVWKNRGIVIEFDNEDRVREIKQRPSIFDNLRRRFGR